MRLLVSGSLPFLLNFNSLSSKSSFSLLSLCTFLNNFFVELVLEKATELGDFGVSFIMNKFLLNTLESGVCGLKYAVSTCFSFIEFYQQINISPDIKIEQNTDPQLEQNYFKIYQQKYFGLLFYQLFNYDKLITNQIFRMSIQSITKGIISRFSNQSARQYSNFKHLSTVYSTDLKMYLHQYAHDKTNARVYHFENSDPENTYASIVKTYVKNDKGCPHILQHLACCGSQKYPLRDPFFNMVKRSLNTYMNAWTGHDFTSYPFASANPKDFENLYTVYLDMSLKPLLKELDFRQEGWRFQLNDQGKKQLKGIVFNEMKGAYQDADMQLMTQINKQLYQGTPYIYSSGGDPKQIVNLEYSQLINMYEYYYHPSNMAFFYYGNNKIQSSLNYLSNEYLNKYQDKSQIYSKLQFTPQPVKNQYKSVISHSAESNNISMNFYLGLLDSLTPLQSLCLRIVNYILLDKSNALVYKKFIESGIAQNIGFSGFNESKLATFSITLKGIYPHFECQQFQKQFRDILQDIIANGIDQSRVEQFLHQFQINILTPRENNGIKVLQQCMHLMNHRLSLDSFLNPRPFIEEAVQKLADPKFVTSLLNKFFLQNNHFTIIRQLMAQTQYKEELIQSKIIMDNKKIKQQQVQLSIRQNEKQNADLLPIIKIEEIVKPVRVSPQLIHSQSTKTKQFEQYHVKINENINYYRLVFNFSQVDKAFLEKVSLWTDAINRTISTDKFSYNQLTSKLANHTAGFNVTHSIGGNEDFNIIFEFSCLKKNVKMAFQLLQQIILTPKFEKQNTLNAFRAFKNEATEGLVEDPENQASNEAAGQLTKAGAILNSYQRIKESLLLIRDKKIQDLYQISLWMNKCSHIKLIEHSNESSIAIPSLVQNLLKIEGQNMSPLVLEAPTYQKAVTYNYAVNFCTQHYKAPKYLSKEHAHISLLLELLQQNYLHPLIRQKGGAYGSYARVKNSGTISLVSYRDPNSTETFRVFDTSIHDLLSKNSIEDQMLLQAKIKQFRDVDRIKIPQNEGVNQIIRGYANSQYELFRQTLKHAGFRQLKQTGAKYLTNTLSSKCIFGKQCPSGFKQQKLKDYLI